MIPLTNKEEIKHKHFGFYSTLMRHGKYGSLYGVITTLLLPVTVQVIGGQYGLLVYVPDKSIEPRLIILSLTDISVLHEAILISLLFFAHLIGFIGVIKKWAAVLLFYSLVRVGESILYFFWFISVTQDRIKSHVMSQIVLGWCCFFAFIIEVTFTSIIHLVTFNVIKYKKE